ncbi:MAG: DUF6498-containing protein [Gammaproteobacteria bacterium]|nr:DUF6498-containing protein [Gammaproteobacteria bacterium]
MNRVPDRSGHVSYCGRMHAFSDSIADASGPVHRLGARGVAALSLFAANAGMLFLFFALDLTLFEVVVVYWFEALWVGLFSGLKLVTASLFGDPYENRWIDVSRGSGVLLSLIAIVKSGGAFFLIVLLAGVALIVAQQELTGLDGSEFVREQAPLLFKCSMLFVAGHGLSYIINFLFLGECRRARAGALMWLPFKRSIALLVTIAAGLTAIQTWPGVLTYTTFPALLIAVKLVWDYFLHRRERRSFSSAGIEEHDAQ